jgi:hypothetical protein
MSYTGLTTALHFVTMEPCAWYDVDELMKYRQNDHSLWARNNSASATSDMGGTGIRQSHDTVPITVRLCVKVKDKIPQIPVSLNNVKEVR